MQGGALKLSAERKGNAMHFYLLRGLDETGTKVNRKIIACDDETAIRRGRENFPQIEISELLDCEPISWYNPSSVCLPTGHCYIVFGKQLTYTPHQTLLDFEQNIEADSDDVAANIVSKMYSNHEIQEPQLLRCRIVFKK